MISPVLKGLLLLFSSFFRDVALTWIHTYIVLVASLLATQGLLALKISELSLFFFLGLFLPCRTPNVDSSTVRILCLRNHRSGRGNS